MLFVDYPFRKFGLTPVYSSLDVLQAEPARFNSISITAFAPSLAASSPPVNDCDYRRSRYLIRNSEYRVNYAIMSRMRGVFSAVESSVIHGSQICPSKVF